ncbi:MAG: HAD family hydrolase [Armatimonadota bacterium]
MQSSTLLSGIRAICADFDGTIADTRLDFDLMRQRVRQFAAQEGLDGQHFVERYVLELVAEIEDRLQPGSRSAARFRRRCEAMMSDMELAAVRGGRLFSGAGEALAELSESGRRVAVVTRNCRRAVEEFRGRHPFECHAVVTRDDVRRVKPDPEHLWQALRLLGVPSEEAAMIGDHPTDMQCGRAAGMVAVGVLTSRSRAEALTEAGAELVIPSLAHLPQHLP